MNYKILICYLVASFSSMQIKAQVFTPLGVGFDVASVNSITIDTINGIVYAGGNFWHSGSKVLNGIGKWDGFDWDSLGSGSSGIGSPIFATVMYQGNLVVGGAFVSMGGISGIGIGLWDGIQWNDIGDIQSPNGYGGVNGLETIDNDLFAVGDFSLVNGVTANMVSKWNGISWSMFNDLDTTGWLASIKKYNNLVYVGGNFRNPANMMMSDISLMNGMNWLPVSNGLNGTISWIGSMAEFQGDLYVAGAFYTVDGNPGNIIARWDGNMWLPMGSGIDNGSVKCLAVFDDELYIGGNFSSAGGIPVSFIVRWDGSQFIALPNATFSHGINTMAAWNNDLYIGGAFTEVNGITVNRIVKYSLPTSLEESSQMKKEIKVYPNLTSGLVSIEIKIGQLQRITIYDISGKNIFSKQLQAQKESVNLCGYSPGVYVLKIETSLGTVHRKVILKSGY